MHFDNIIFTKAVSMVVQPWGTSLGFFQYSNSCQSASMCFLDLTIHSLNFFQCSTHIHPLIETLKSEGTISLINHVEVSKVIPDCQNGLILPYLCWEYNFYRWYSETFQIKIHNFKNWIAQCLFREFNYVVVL